jgi:glycosyltransferase involved in cell wall biosynthesis
LAPPSKCWPVSDHHQRTIGIDASRSAFEQPTGTERYSQRIIAAILDAAPSYRFRLYLNARVPLPIAVRAGTTQRTIPFPRLWTLGRLSAEILRHPVDALFVPSHVVPLVHPAATVVTIHDLGYLHEPAAHETLARRYLDLSTQWSCFAARRVIAVSQATQRDLVSHYGVPPAKIDVVYHGVESRFLPVDSDERARVGRELRLPDRYLLHVGTLQPRKNLVRLVRAFEALASEQPDLHLVLAGRIGWLAEPIEAAIASSAGRGRITILGHVADDAFPALYTGAAAVAIPSLYEGFGLPALEAMACGAPVVVSARGALPEVVGTAGILVDPLSVQSLAKGLRLALDPANRARIAEVGRRRAAEFTWEAAGRRTLEVIESAMGASGCA